MSRNHGIATLAAAALLLLSVLVQSWWSESALGASFKVGLTRVSMSAMGMQRETALDHDGEDAAWATVGTLTWWIGLVAGGMLALLALEGLVGFSVALPLARIAGVLCVLGLLGAGLFFLLLKPKGMDAGASWGFFAYAAGAFVGVLPKR